jgi:AcrR family transcriptional regulator
VSSRADTSATPDAGRRYRRQSADERRAERRGKLVEAAVEAFGTQGYAATTIEQLCTAAGISTRNFYEEFGGREELLVALHDDLNRRALAAVVESLVDVDPDDVAARAHTAVLAYLRVMTSDRRWARIALVESVGVSAAAEQHRRDAIGGFVALIDAEANRLAQAGRAERRDYGLTAVALAGAINGLINTWTATEEWDAQVPRIADEAARLIVLALTR